MKQFEKVLNFCENHKKILLISCSAVLSVLFIVSILIAVFSGGEFAETSKTVEVKGLLQLNETGYSTNYLSGDKFSFDKERADITLIAKDPAIDHVVKIEKLPASEYGFLINGKGDVIDEAEQSTMTKDIKSVSVVSKYYPDLKVNIPVNVVSTDGIEFKQSLLLEAESAKLYKDNKLISEEDKLVLPETDKPYNSSAGTPAGTECSGGACLRNFQSSNMRVEFEIISTEEVEVSFVIKYCMRRDGKTFGEYYKVKLNGREDKTIAAIKTEVGEDYFTPADLQTVTLKLVRGVNVITFESGTNVGTQNPANLDAITLTCDKAVLGVFPA